MTNLEWLKTLDVKQFAVFLNELTSVHIDTEDYVPYCCDVCEGWDINDYTKCDNCIECWLEAPHTEADEWRR